MLKIMNVFACAVALVLLMQAALEARAETDDRVLLARVRELRDAVQRCQANIASGKSEECLVRTRWNNRQISMAEALDIANELEPKRGVWTPAEAFAIQNMTCWRTYYCGPSSSLHNSNTTIIPSPAEIVFGACSAAGADPEGCNRCLTHYPSKACTWHLER
jgi:hypothetical protein